MTVSLPSLRNSFMLVILYLFIIYHSVAQKDTSVLKPDTLSNKSLIIAGTGLTTGYSATLLVLSKTWYKQSARTSFHFFNDNTEWLQLDKLGHFHGAFHISRLGIKALQRTTLTTKQAILYGGLLGFVLQSPIEWLDGHVVDYGASVGDLGANALGSLAVISQELAWGHIKIMPKYSYRPSPYAKIRPEVLGSNFTERILKDYNGQTYWLSADVAAFLSSTSKYPKWLNVAIGYSGNGMIYGKYNTNKKMGFYAYRQFYLAPDLNLLSVKTNNKILKKAFYLVSIIRLPLPAVEYNSQHGFKLHPLFF